MDDSDSSDSDTSINTENDHLEEIPDESDGIDCEFCSFTPPIKKQKVAKNPSLSSSSSSSSSSSLSSSSIVTYVGRKKIDPPIWHANPLSVVSRHHKPTSNINKYKYNQILLPNKKLATPMDCVSLFLDDEYYRLLVKYTNQKGQEKMGSNWSDTNLIEMKAFLGLLIAMGNTKSNFVAVHQLWNPLYGGLIFRGTMSLNRFRLIRRFLRFDQDAGHFVFSQTYLTCNYIQHINILFWLIRIGLKRTVSNDQSFWIL